MHGERCDLCGARAAIHETAIENSQIVVTHLCEQHGKGSIPTIPFTNQENAFRTVVEMYNSLSDFEKNEFALLHRLSRRRA
jgi:hypothetical protein